MPSTAAPSPYPPSYFTARTASDLSQFSEKTIRRACLSGELLAHKKHRQWRIRPEAIDAWISNNGSARMGRKPRPLAAGMETARRLLLTRPTKRQQEEHQ